MKESRCGRCDALLFKIENSRYNPSIEIKCRRCGTINHLRAESPLSDRPRATLSEVAHEGEDD